ncbi:MAG: hypothetical protein JOY99_04815 [Sphingomonadaceae bacterium]|nr:hypothetical protein [Sphingomonadaceae bacterium]
MDATLERNPDRYAGTRALPWNTPPSGEGSRRCGWCGRTIYRPAEPCSTAPIADIEALVQPPAPGDRCLWEMRTRGLLATR